MTQLRIIRYQVLLILLAEGLAVIFFLDRPDVLKALLFGGFVSISTTAWLALRLNQAVTSLKKGSKKSVLYVYLGAVEKFILAIVLFGVGIALLKMHPLPIMAGLVAGQLGFSIGSYKLNK